MDSRHRSFVESIILWYNDVGSDWRSFECVSYLCKMYRRFENAMNDWLWFGGIAGLILGLVLFFWLSPLLDPLRSRWSLQRHANSFYKAFVSLPDLRMRRAVYAVYSFCRTLDQTIHARDAKEKLEAFEEAFMKAIEGQRVQHWVFAELMWAVETYYPEDYDYAPYFDKLRGTKTDLDHQPFETMNQLIDYCALVAGSVGRMLNLILANEETPARKSFAIDLGVAMQLTNILRSIGEDDASGRRYIPNDLLHQYGIDWNQERDHGPSEAFTRLLEQIASMAETRYETVLSSLSLYNEDVRTSLGLSILMHKAILAQIRLDKFAVFQRRSVVSRTNKRRLFQEWFRSERTKR
jgi:phytoene/squalene synthetase